MYDALTGLYTLACPARGETKVRLSAFRRLERLPGAAHPAVYRVEFRAGSTTGRRAATRAGRRAIRHTRPPSRTAVAARPTATSAWGGCERAPMLRASARVEPEAKERSHEPDGREDPNRHVLDAARDRVAPAARGERDSSHAATMPTPPGAGIVTIG